VNSKIEIYSNYIGWLMIANKTGDSGNAKGKVGIYIATALVVGNMIGSGIFLLPSALAEYGGISILGWIASGMAAFVLAIVFGRLSKLLPKTGGPYAFAKKGYGDFSGFLVGWGYWISILATNAAIAVGFAGYLTVFFPAIEGSNVHMAFVAIGAIWILTWVNSRGIKSGGAIQLVTTVLKILPLLTISIVGLFFFDIDHFIPFNVSAVSDVKAVAATLTITLFAFLGVESATVPADNIHDPKKTIPRATLIGTLLTIGVYMISSVSVMGLLSPEELAASPAPFADAAQNIIGETGKYLVGLGALISTFGALNGWILIQSQMPYAMAMDKMFPPIFARKNKKDFPVVALIISSIIVTLIVYSNFTKGLVGMFTFLILLGTFTNLIAYIFSSMAEVLILIKTKPEKWEKKVLRSFIVGVPAFIFSIWAIYGAGQDIVFYGFLALMAGMPFYVWSKIEQTNLFKKVKE
jgi:APA family basic amino acid/polyamine antiporter